ncbi:unnamed protein product [Prorocentrum cordatum]|uniref:Uncharacterized protein n=1 Tax=Prorocentrum cordatum TaxID=2364126 RepID=A0ABN9UNN0_9DINO|nr:unnamed protein product [Polarella glacialis]
MLGIKLQEIANHTCLHFQAAARPPRGAEPKLRGSATDWKMTAAVAGRPLSGAGTARGPARTRTALSRHSGWEKDMLSVEVLFQKLNLPVQNHNSSFICTAGSPSPPTPASLPPRSGTISPMASTLRKDDVEGG